MATYNGEKYLREQIDSILIQLSETDELVVSDDGSNDSTINIIKSYNDTRIKIYINENHHGINGNFENALRHASGDFIFLSDQDDVWHKDKIRTCLSSLDSNDCVIHDCQITDENLNVMSESLLTNLGAKPGVLNNILRNGFTGCCMAFRKEVLKSIIPFPRDTIFFHDQWIGLKASLKFKTIFINQRLIYFRRHKSNSSSAADKSKLSFIDKVKYRLFLCKSLFFLFD